MERTFDIEELLNIDISPYLNKGYIDMLNKLDDLNHAYNETYESISDILDRDLFDDLYRSHMSMTAAFDSSRLGLKGKDRIEILEQSYKKKYKSIENHIDILKETDIDISKEYIKHIYSLLTNQDPVYRTLPRYRRFSNGKMLCSTNIDKDLTKLIKFINNDKFGKYTLVNVAIVQLAILSIAPFPKNNRFISITLADKLIEKHYGKPIFMETVLYRVGKNNDSLQKEIRRFWRTFDFTNLMHIYVDSIITEMESNILFLNKLKNDIKELYKILDKSNIKSTYIPKLIRFLILNNTFKIRDLYNRLGSKDRRTILKITQELETIGVISNISNSRVKKYKVDDRWHNDFKLYYKIK